MHSPEWVRHNERVVKVFRLHWAAWIGNVVPVILAVAAFIAVELIVEHRFSWIAWIGCAIGFIAASASISSVRSTHLTITNERLVYGKSLLGMRRFEVPLDRIFNLDIEQHALGRLLGFGTLTVQSPSSNMKPITHLKHPFDAQQAIYHAAEELQLSDARGREPRGITDTEIVH